MRVTIVLVAAAFLLAGCSDKSGGKGAFGEDVFDDTPEVASGKGLIRGIVVSSAIVPVPDATVKLTPTDAEVRTDENGAFVFLDLDPGTYFVSVSKIAWTETQQSVDVVADVQEPPILKVLIDRIPGAEPRADTQHLEGYISCSFGTPATFTNCNTTEQQRSRLFWDVPVRPDYIQTEIIWKSTQPTGEWLYIIQGVCSCDGGIPGRTSSARFNETPDATSPYVVRIGPDFMEDEDVGGEAVQMVIDVSASGPEPETTNGSGLALNQKFNIYATFFYNFEPDPKWTFGEDGPYPVPSGG